MGDDAKIPRGLEASPVQTGLKQAVIVVAHGDVIVVCAIGPTRHPFPLWSARGEDKSVVSCWPRRGNSESRSSRTRRWQRVSPRATRSGTISSANSSNPSPRSCSRRSELIKAENANERSQAQNTAINSPIRAGRGFGLPTDRFGKYFHPSFLLQSCSLADVDGGSDFKLLFIAGKSLHFCLRAVALFLLKHLELEV